MIVSNRSWYPGARLVVDVATPLDIPLANVKDRECSARVELVPYAVNRPVWTALGRSSRADRSFRACARDLGRGVVATSRTFGHRPVGMSIRAVGR